MFNYSKIYYVFTFFLILYKVITYIKNKNKNLKDYTKKENVSVLFLSSTKDDVLSLLPIINNVDKNKIPYFVITNKNSSLKLLKMSLINSINLELINNNTIFEMIYSLFRFKPKVLITTASNGFKIIILLAKIIKCKIIIIDNGRNILKNNNLLKLIGNKLYIQSEEGIEKKYKKIGNLKILNSMRYINNTKTDFFNIMLVTQDFNKFNNYCEAFSKIKNKKSNSRLFCIIPIDFKYNSITVMKYNKINYYIWNNEPVDLNTILIDYDLILSFDLSVLKYFSSKSKITILNTCIDKKCTYTLSEIAINKNCILYDSNCKNNLINKYLFDNNIILKINSDNYEYLIDLINNKKLQEELINNSYNWILELKKKTSEDVRLIINQIREWL